MNKKAIFTLLVNHFFLKFISILFIYIFIEQKNEFSNVFTLVSTVVVVISLNTGLPLQSLLSKGRISEEMFWWSSLLFTTVFSLFLIIYLELNALIIIVAIINWFFLQLLCYIHAKKNNVIWAQSFITTINLILILLFSMYYGDGVKKGFYLSDFFVYICMFLAILLFALFFRVYIKNIKQLIVVINGIKFRVFESIFITLFQYSFLISIASNVDTGDGFVFLVLTQVSSVFALVPTILSSYLLKNLSGCKYDKFYSKLLNYNMCFVFFVIAFCLLIGFKNIYYVYPLTFVFGSVFRIITVKLIDMEKTQVPMISNVSQVIIFFIIMTVSSSDSYSDYATAFVIASIISSFIYYLGAKKCF